MTWELRVRNNLNEGIYVKAANTDCFKRGDLKNKKNRKYVRAGQTGIYNTSVEFTPFKCNAAWKTKHELELHIATTCKVLLQHWDRRGSDDDECRSRIYFDPQFHCPYTLIVQTRVGGFTNAEKPCNDTYLPETRIAICRKDRGLDCPTWLRRWKSSGNKSHDNSVIANTFYGKVEGKLVTLTDGAKFHVFLGIPYAKPPIGDLRFAKPLPPDHWDGIRDAKTFFTWCIQDTESNVHSDPNTKEDCLYLNVFTPDTASHEVGFQNGYPVMFWVHGGGFYTGSSVEYPTQGILDYLVRRNVIVVTINYRLWTLGFLSTGDDAAPGNWGLWDQTRALEWVQGNIRFFGGDPHKVTIFGESAGAAATSALSLSPQSNGLFQQVISQSGSVFDSFGSHNKTFTAKYTKELAMAAYCPEAPSRSLIDCLRSKNVTQLKIAAKKMGGSKLAFTFEGFKFGPVQDGYFFPDTMQNLAAKAPKKPTIMGVNSLEAALYEYLLGKSQKELINDPNFGVDYLMGKLEIPLYQFYLNDRQKAEFKAVIQQVYFENDKQNKTMLIYNYFKLSSDIIFDKGAYEEAKYKSTAGSPVWMYVFDFYNDNMFPQGTIVKGAYHAMELAYLFATDTMIPHVTSLDRLVASHLQTMWTNFAIYGCPTTGQWQRFSEARPQYLDIKPILQMKPVFNPKMIKVFEDILPKIKQ